VQGEAGRASLGRRGARDARRVQRPRCRRAPRRMRGRRPLEPRRTCIQPRMRPTRPPLLGCAAAPPPPPPLLPGAPASPPPAPAAPAARTGERFLHATTSHWGRAGRRWGRGPVRGPLARAHSACMAKDGMRRRVRRRCKSQWACRDGRPRLGGAAPARRAARLVTLRVRGAAGHATPWGGGSGRPRCTPAFCVRQAPAAAGLLWRRD
jgi:hypothetical protein